MTKHPSVRRQGGAALLEALIAMLIVAFGALGFIGLQARTAVVNLEGYQRAQALVLVNDMAQRIAANRANAASYVTTGFAYTTGTAFVGANDPGVCGGTRAQIDVCEWTRLLRGAAEGTTVGVVNKARGCIQRIDMTNDYIVAVFWEGYQGTGRTAVHCGTWTGTGGVADPGFANDVLRAVSVVVRIGTLA